MPFTTLLSFYCPDCLDTLPMIHYTRYTITYQQKVSVLHVIEQNLGTLKSFDCVATAIPEDGGKYKVINRSDNFETSVDLLATIRHRFNTCTVPLCSCSEFESTFIMCACICPACMCAYGVAGKRVPDVQNMSYPLYHVQCVIPSRQSKTWTQHLLNSFNPIDGSTLMNMTSLLATIILIPSGMI